MTGNFAGPKHLVCLAAVGMCLAPLPGAGMTAGQLAAELCRLALRHRQLRDTAPEVLEIEVLSISVKAKKSIFRHEEAVVLDAEILSVKRSSERPQPGRAIRIKYQRQPGIGLWDYEFAPPILTTGQRVTAYLRKGKSSYEPAGELNCFDSLDDGFRGAEGGFASVLVAVNPAKKECLCIRDAGGFACVGIGMSKTINLALDKARTMARAAVGDEIASAANSMLTDYAAERGSPLTREEEAMAETAIAAVRQAACQNAVTINARDFRGGDDFYYVSALAAEHPIVLSTIVEQAGETLREAIMGSKMGRAVQDRIARYEALRQEHAGEAGGESRVALPPPPDERR